MTKDFFNRFYQGNYKFYFIVPIILLIICLILLPYVPKSVDIKGGTYLTIYSSANTSETEIENYLKSEFGLKDVDVKYVESLNGNFVEIQYVTPELLLNLKEEIAQIRIDGKKDELLGFNNAIQLLEGYGVNTEDLKNRDFEYVKKELNTLYTDQKNKETQKILAGLNKNYNIDVKTFDIKEIDPVLGEAFYQNILNVSIWAAILIIIVIFIFFREFIPSAAVLMAGALDILGGLAGMAIFDVPISLVTIPALLMLLGYSIDTDILLTTRLLKRTDGTLRSRAGEAMKTGMTMTVTTLIALTIMLIIAILYNVQVIYYISIVLISGLIADLIATWFMNGPMLLWYIESWKKR